MINNSMYLGQVAVATESSQRIPTPWLINVGTSIPMAGTTINHLYEVMEEVPQPVQVTNNYFIAEQPVLYQPSNRLNFGGITTYNILIKK